MKSRKRWLSTLAVFLSFALVAAACSDDSETTTTLDSGTDTTVTPGAGAPDDFQIGIILVGPEFDKGYSQAHFEGAQYAIEQHGLPEQDRNSDV